MVNNKNAERRIFKSVCSKMKMAEKHEKLENLEREYELQLEKAIEKIMKLKVCAGKMKKEHRKPIVLLQFPDGLKPYALEVADYIEEKTGGRAEIIIWLGSCFGACDIPKTKADLLIQFGHSKFRRNLEDRK